MNAGSVERRDSVRIASSKITPRHLERLAIVYVRQSHAIQIIKNPESTRVQYSLTDHAVALGLQRRPWTDPFPCLFQIHGGGALVDLWRRDRDPPPVLRSEDHQHDRRNGDAGGTSILSGAGGARGGRGGETGKLWSAVESLWELRRRSPSGLPLEPDACLSRGWDHSSGDSPLVARSLLARSSATCCR